MASTDTTPRNGSLSQNTKLDVIVERVSYIVESVEELKKQVSLFEEKRMTEWIEYKVEHAKIVNKISEIEVTIHNNKEGSMNYRKDTSQQINSLMKSIKDLEDNISPLIVANKILVWVGGVLGASVIIFIWSIITHAVQIVATK